MKDNYAKIKKIISQYLKTHQLSKITYLTNCLPNKDDNEYLLEDFNYVCFCVSDYNTLSRTLFLKYKYGYKKIPFDVLVGEIPTVVYKRPFGYAWFTKRNSDEITDLVQYVSIQKTKINRKYPILLRVSSVSDNVDRSSFPENCHIQAILSPNDLLLRIS